MKAVLVVDMLKDFVEEGAPLEVERAREFVGDINCLLDEARSQGNLVVFVCDRHREDDPEFDVFPEHCVESTEGAEVLDGLDKREEDIVIPKRRFSAFFGTDLDLTLREHGVDELVVVGILTNICVLYTVADAVQRGYEVTVCSDLVTSPDQEAHEFALEQMADVLGADVTKC
ncbi:isochorismatase family cysteine hydrolase [Methanonatronarchaeum sp. AMET-Sl]|uniref:cysteine hydrolase family protein n=1 Tax=Methanonatronarchaeum sp. AMET-Sl TaxID=3037654 RepID=UPI00244DC387|nr:isochorismatase family cysteine hydrolase [Methanonatronarchaeum sp. AMET-Sl]WGI18112.1 cysteine hydrolase [Methanonatronarchaeum sp. AMET-Sl]